MHVFIVFAEYSTIAKNSPEQRVIISKHVPRAMINSAIHCAPFASVYATGVEVGAFCNFWVHVTISGISVYSCLSARNNQIFIHRNYSSVIAPFTSIKINQQTFILGIFYPFSININVLTCLRQLMK
jgi:hypothetical protein